MRGTLPYSSCARGSPTIRLHESSCFTKLKPCLFPVSFDPSVHSKRSAACTHTMRGVRMRGTLPYSSCAHGSPTIRLSRSGYGTKLKPSLCPISFDPSVHSTRCAASGCGARCRTAPARTAAQAHDFVSSSVTHSFHPPISPPCSAELCERPEYRGSSLPGARCPCGALHVHMICPAVHSCTRFAMWCAPGQCAASCPTATAGMTVCLFELRCQGFCNA